MIGEAYAKIKLQFNVEIEVVITLEKEHLNVLDIVTTFQPPTNTLKDYFLRVQSDVRGNNDFYHDANGYLVMRRVFDERPDYEFKPVADDKINANTYPTTTFAYIKDATNKMLVSLDRAEGVAIYEQDSLLMNLDRLTEDDGKGAGESYSYVIKNVFRHRVAITKVKDDLERVWQKHYDEPIFGLYGTRQSSTEPPKTAVISETDLNKYLKLTTAVLNDHSIVVRLQNMAEFTDLTVDLYNDGKLELPEFKLSLAYKDIKETFHNGIPLGPRYRWVKPIDGDVVDIHKNTVTDGRVTLRPLQIRSFRVDFTTAIKGARMTPFNEAQQLINSDLTKPQKIKIKHARCY